MRRKYFDSGVELFAPPGPSSACRAQQTTIHLDRITHTGGRQFNHCQRASWNSLFSLIRNFPFAALPILEQLSAYVVLTMLGREECAPLHADDFWQTFCGFECVGRSRRPNTSFVSGLAAEFLISNNFNPVFCIDQKFEFLSKWLRCGYFLNDNGYLVRAKLAGNQLLTRLPRWVHWKLY